MHDRVAVIDWLLEQGRQAISAQRLLDAFCRRLMEAGLPLWRAVCGLQLLHPQIRSTSYFWRRDRGAVEMRNRLHGAETEADDRISPFGTLMEEGADGMRYRLEQMEGPWPYAILGQLREQGATDYVAMTVRFASGRRNVLSLATDRPGGFSTEDLALVDSVLPAFGAVLETLALRRLSTTVLDTYVGRRTGARILSGDIRRGTGDNVRAVLWYCDLRGFTSLADRLPREELIALLNGYFEAMGGAVEEHGGEILKFIGDAMLTIFPLDGDADGDGAGANGRGGEAEACAKALEAAIAAIAAMERLNAARAAWGQPTLRCGIALHIGDVMYGNIGSPTRLDFTVIGPAVNLVSRIDGLCNELNRTMLTSAAFAAAFAGACTGCGSRLVSLGHHPVKGLEEPVEVFELTR
jgi:adenylate cyclase